MSQENSLKVFIGSGEASVIERKVAIHSLEKHTSQNIDVYVFNGTHNSVELNQEEPFLAPMPLKVKYQNSTEFSLYRYLIPQLCNFQGKAVYIDSDVVCLDDILKLFQIELNGSDFLAKFDAYPSFGDEFWGLSVMLIDCERCRFDLELICQEISQGLYSMLDFSCMSPHFLRHHSYKIGKLSSHWNSFDLLDEHTKLIHYTNLYTQPWKSVGHPYGDIWFDYFEDARKAGKISQKEIEKSMMLAYVRHDLLAGNSPSLFYKLKRNIMSFRHGMRRYLKFYYSQLLGLFPWRTSGR